MKCFCLALVAAVLVLPIDAGAKIIDVATGVKMTIGGNIWTKPSDVPYGLDIGFPKTRGGYGGGAGIWGEVRFVKFVGVMAEFLVEQDFLWENDTIYTGFGAIDLKPKASTVNLRIPLLVRGHLPLPGVRLSIGLGPEFVIPLSSSATVGHASGVTVPADTFKVKTRVSTMLAMDLGITIGIWNGIVLPINIRGSKNLTQPSAYKDRVTIHSGNSGFTLLYQNSWDLRLLLGLGYEF